jgi:hypothetical protein
MRTGSTGQARTRRRLRGAAAGFWLALAALAGPAAAGGPVTVGDAAGLDRALGAATGGIILLEPGSYGDLVVQRLFPAQVTLRAVAPRGAVFAEISIEGGGNLLFDGIATEAFRAGKGASQVGLINAQVGKLVYARDVRGLRIEGNDIRGQQFGVLLNSVQDAVVRDNTIHDAIEDLLRITGDSADVLVEGNRLLDLHPQDNRATGGHRTHSDAIQLFAAKGKTPRGIVIRRNHIWDDPATGAPGSQPQGIFVSDPATGGYRNILIEENLVAVQSPNSIYINGGQENVVVRNNTLIPSPGDGGAMIRLAEKSGMDNSGTTVTGNVVKLIRDETRRSAVRSNYVYGRGAPLARIFSGPGRRWQDFLPHPNARIASGSGLGAEAYLSDLLAGR